MGRRLLATSVGVAVVIATLVVVVVTQTRHGEAQAIRLQSEDTTPLDVSVLRLEASDGFTRDMRLTGSVMARQAVELAFEPAGRVTRVDVDRGDSVARGDVLATLDTRRLESRLVEVQARIDEARAALTLASRQETRASRLAQSNNASQDALDRARTDRLTQQARLSGLEGERTRLEADIEDSTLKAPFAGRILERHIDTGSLVGEGAAAFRLVDVQHLEAHLGLPASLASHFTTGQTVTLSRNGVTLDGAVRASLPQVEADSRTLTLVVDLAPGAPVVPGDLVELHHAIEQPAPGYWVPLDALLAGDRGLWSLLVAEPLGDSDHRVSRASVEVLHTRMGRAYVRGTLEDGMAVIDAGTHRVTPGQRVRLVEDERS
ncbi:efflux RND transporter periplasmic adaptor subunit [Halomonas urumqiensis]|uniref:Efflux RND transporter periplasmic adaptor subunit n=2 Tax=Halomonas urumqiensis TaxID=1684789 RepID=A0A2N7UDX6_9GAMM|nr:efflux RND transporter periplasmic adaptor subunit [Halomonas urumqiensis]PTB04315.1 efflux RND transporter periplasmic adaptor subunit [Halomonas urumqiensis]